MRNITAFESLARTANENSSMIISNYKGCNIVIDMTTETVEGTVTLTGGASGSVDTITVNGVDVMSGAEAFDSDLSTTATNVAANITANTSVPDYTAVAVGAVITITSIVGGNTFVVTSATTTITTTDVDMASAGDVVFKLEGFDPLSTKNYLILASASITTIGTTVLSIMPSVAASANVSVSTSLPQNIRVTATHTGAYSMTYSVGINYVL